MGREKRTGVPKEILTASVSAIVRVFFNVVFAVLLFFGAMGILDCVLCARANETEGMSE
jgi:hypothetical protein